MKERQALEEQYAKALQKLAAKAGKLEDATPKTTVATAWRTLLKEMEAQAAYHTCVAGALREHVVDPFGQLRDEQHKEHKKALAGMEKLLKKVDESTAAVVKAQRAAHARTRDAEAAAQAVDDADQPPPPGQKVGARGSQCVWEC
jgi:hypothetical protein